MLKYEHIEVGTRVKAYDHEPFPGREERYLEGEVCQHITDQFGVKFLLVRVSKDATFTKPGHTRVGLYVHVPMEMMFEYDEVDRVQVIA